MSILKENFKKSTGALVNLINKFNCFTDDEKKK